MVDLVKQTGNILDIPVSERPYLLTMENMEKSFPGVKALNNAQLKVRKGTIHALIGENGAGKSTLMKCLFGIYHRDSGEVKFDGRDIAFKNPKEAIENGIAMVHQELNQALPRNIMDNMWLGRYPRKGIMIDEAKMYKDTKAIFEELGLDINPKRIMKTMSVSQRQMVEIAKAVSYNSKIIVLDEPTSSLNDREVEQLFKIIFKLRAEGCGIIYISHKMEEILKIADEITVMRDGQYITTDLAANMDLAKMIKLMVGREISNRFPPKTNHVGEPIMEVDNITGTYNIVKDVSFKLYKGEVLGIAGLDGAGRTELLDLIYGTATRKDGRIKLHGKNVLNRTARESIKNGFALLTEERRATGIFGIRSILDNTVISSLPRYLRYKFFLSNQAMKDATFLQINAMKIKTPSEKTAIQTLSGGNQQKVIIGRWLLTEPEVLMLDEPTRGIDVGAKYEIYQLINKMAEQDRAVIMVSSEMPELLGVCDRILVMSGGRLAGEVNAKTTTQEEIMHLATKYV